MVSEKDELDNVKDNANKRIGELKVELERVNKIRKDQDNINEKLNKQLDLKLSNLRDPEQFVPKKIAALEVYKEVVMSKNTYIYAIVTSFLIAASSAYFTVIGAIVAGVVSMGFAVMMLKKMQRMKYLENQYGLIRPKLFKKAQ